MSIIPGCLGYAMTLGSPDKYLVTDGIVRLELQIKEKTFYIRVNLYYMYQYDQYLQN